MFDCIPLPNAAVLQYFIVITKLLKNLYEILTKHVDISTQSRKTYIHLVGVSEWGGGGWRVQGRVETCLCFMFMFCKSGS